MQVGIIGTPGCGKSTLFHALTGRPASVSGKKEMMRGMAEVYDERVDRLAETFNSRKKSYALVEYLDAPPLEAGSLRKESFRREFLRGLEQTDALLLVIPCFLPGQLGEAPDLLKDTETEFILSDLEILEKRLERVRLDLQRGAKGELESEVKLLEKCKTALEAEQPLCNLNLLDDEVKRLRSFSFITMRRLLVILNIAEIDLPLIDNIVDDFIALTGLKNTVGICSEIQSEIADLPEEEIPAFLQEMGVSERAKDRILRKTRQALDLINFLTVSEEEARAWDLKRGSTAPQAAGVVHTDMEKGFIRAETFAFSDLGNSKTYGDLRNRGVLRSEGKDYIVKEGDVLLFRFNV